MEKSLAINDQKGTEQENKNEKSLRNQGIITGNRPNVKCQKGKT